MSKQLALFGLGLLLLAIDPVPAQEKQESSRSGPVKKLTVHLVDADNNPVSGAHVGTRAILWHKRLRPELADAAGFMYLPHSLSNNSGVAEIESKEGDLRDPWGRIGIVARHDGRGLVAIADIDSTHLTRPLSLTLVPECRVSGTIHCPELAKLGRKVGWTNVYLSIGRNRLMGCDSEEGGDFHFFLPPGRYSLNAYGTYLASKNQSITVSSDKREMKLDLTAPATRFALLRGLPAPELREIVGWKNSAPLRLADLKGKCVVLHFWGYWCGPCIHEMPAMFELYDRYAKQGLVVIGVHVEVGPEGIDSAAKLDAKLADIRKAQWHGRDIPYPVAFTKGLECQVLKDYGVRSFPSQLLIDRRGNLVDILTPGPKGVAVLQKCLDEKAGNSSASGVRGPES
ncbi:MAG TPA: redoxin domain-containing protein [Planctomycetaceae bacterium]|jgi:thiol-disulfide isomerase/thioredoxin|nr:redoxin domain-containing protein [Planctomycetaceae bacterium]